MPSATGRTLSTSTLRRSRQSWKGQVCQSTRGAGCPETVSSHYSAFSRLRETISLAKDRARKMSSGIGGRGSSSVALGIGSRGVSSIALGGRGLGSPLGGSTVPAASSVNLWTGNQGIGWVSYSIFCLEIHCWPVFSSPGQYIVGKCIHCFMGGGAHCAHTGTSRLQGTAPRDAILGAGSCFFGQCPKGVVVGSRSFQSFWAFFRAVRKNQSNYNGDKGIQALSTEISPLIQDGGLKGSVHWLK